MNNYYFGDKSKENCTGVHHDLIEVANRALELSEVDFSLIEGVRSKERQAEVLESGNSWTVDSRHLDGHAFDIAAIDKNGEVSWDNLLYDKIAEAWFKAAIELNVQIEWGGFWEQCDAGHFQLSRKEYPSGP